MQNYTNRDRRLQQIFQNPNTADGNGWPSLVTLLGNWAHPDGARPAAGRNGYRGLKQTPARLR